MRERFSVKQKDNKHKKDLELWKNSQTLPLTIRVLGYFEKLPCNVYCVLYSARNLLFTKVRYYCKLEEFTVKVMLKITIDYKRSTYQELCTMYID